MVVIDSWMWWPVKA